MAKKKKSNVKNLLGYSMLMGTTALIADKFPAAGRAPIQQVATTGSKFVVPLATVTGVSMMMDALGHLKPKKKYRVVYKRKYRRKK